VQVGLAGCPDGGVFAPTIGHHEGTFYVIVSIAFSPEVIAGTLEREFPAVADMLRHAREDITAWPRNRRFP
jgi:hypothetical protein